MLNYAHFSQNVKYMKIRYNSLKNSLSDITDARLQSLLFSTTSGST